MKTTLRLALLAVPAFGLLGSLQAEDSTQPRLKPASLDPLVSSFVNPPDSAKPHTWWHWINGNISKEGITADLEAMKRAGIGGAVIFNGIFGITPKGPVDIMSPQWRELVAFAAKEADRLGLKLGAHNCPGWSSSGGPWIQPEQGMQTVTTSEVQVKGPIHFSDVLPKPRCWKNPLGDKQEYYWDSALLAFPTPAGEFSTMADAKPVASCNVPEAQAQNMIDGNPATWVDLPLPAKDQNPYIQLEFPAPFTAQSLKLTQLAINEGFTLLLSVSDDGKNFQEVQLCSIPLNRGGTRIVFFPMRTARFFRFELKQAPPTTKQIRIAEFELSPKAQIPELGYRAEYQDFSPPQPLDAKTIASEYCVDPDRMIDLTKHLKPDGRLEWDVPAGDWTILRLGYTPKGTQNSPAPVSGRGLECDKLSRMAVEAHWDGMMAKILGDIGPLVGKTFNRVLIDSYEVHTQNWTPKFREEFKRLRGYDPLPFLPTLSGRFVKSPELSERFLWDFRRTLADLFAEQYSGTFAELAKRNGLQFAVEPYGQGPFEGLQYGSHADIPMGEFWTDNNTMGTGCLLAASIAHVNGRRIVGAEAFTSDKPWIMDPWAIKAQGDAIYCTGINRFDLHTCVHQPWPDRLPGLTLGKFGSHFQHTTPWWEMSPAWIQYLTRCQYLLQEGRFVADAILLASEDAPFGKAASYSHASDTCNRETIFAMSVQDGRLVLPSGMSYRLLVLPDAETMSPQLLKKLRQLIADGALVVVGTKPTRAPGLQDYPNCDQEVAALADEIWGDCDGKKVQEHALGKGKVIRGKSPSAVWEELKLPLDFEPIVGSGKTKLLSIHRQIGEAEVYFVSNQRYVAEEVDCLFRVSGKVPELWDPASGTVRFAPFFAEEKGRTRVRLPLDPAGSVFVVFRKTTGAADRVSAVNRSGEPVAEPDKGGSGDPGFEVVGTAENAVEVRAWKQGTFECKTVAGKQISVAIPEVPQPIELAGPWEVRFQSKRGAPEAATFDKLISWPDHPDQGIKYFSGTATYRKEFEIPGNLLGANRLVYLNLGKVKNLARVKVNGRELGILWKEPFRLEVTQALKPGKNSLEIEVANLWPNRLIGDAQLPEDCEWQGASLPNWPQWLLDGKPSPTGRLTITITQVYKKDSPLLESGLLGPVELQTVERRPINLP
ncbi:MAG: glycosyl hydrolase [Verrucomicrobiota bacterium]